MKSAVTWLLLLLLFLLLLVVQPRLLTTAESSGKSITANQHCYMGMVHDMQYSERHSGLHLSLALHCCTALLQQW